jgi:hypothetical protein
LAAEVQPVANPETQEMFLHMSNSAAQASEAQLQLQHQLAQMQQHMQVMQAQMAASNPQQRQPVYPPPNYNPGFFPNQQQQQPTGGGGFQGPGGFGGRGQGRGYQGHQPGRGRGGYQGFQPYNQQMQGQQQPQYYQQQHGGQQHGRGHQGGGQGRGYQGRGQGGRSGGIRSFNCYCWTHGAGAHPSPDCRTPTQGHQIGATFENKMGGSMRYCQPAATWQIGSAHNLNFKLKTKVSNNAPPNPPTKIIAKTDSGASSHYFKVNDISALTNVCTTPFGPHVMLPDSTTIQATQSGQLPLHRSLSTKATTAHILDGITNSSLISIGQLCDDDCIAVLDKMKLKIYKNQECILQGTRNRTDGLWDISIDTTSNPIQAPRPHQINAIIRKDTTKTQLVQYLYACCGSPVVSTWKKAIRNGNFLTWPGIDDLSIDLHLPKSIASAKGHLNQERKNLQSTRVPLPAQDQNNDQSEDTFFPVAMIVPFTAKNTGYHDLPGRFPHHHSSRGNEYLLIVYDYDGNSILQCPLKNKTAGEIKRGWISIHERLARGSPPGHSINFGYQDYNFDDRCYEYLPSDGYL